MSQWDKIAKRNTAKMLTSVKKTVQQMAERIIVKSPVDTGLFRNNWFTAINTPNLSTTNQTSRLGHGQTGGVRMKEAFSTINKMKIGNTLFFTNNLHYATKLEFGGSRQAPMGMVRVTLANFQGVLDRAIKTKVILNP